jgi:hypothetical protein
VFHAEQNINNTKSLKTQDKQTLKLRNCKKSQQEKINLNLKSTGKTPKDFIQQQKKAG